MADSSVLNPRGGTVTVVHFSKNSRTSSSSRTIETKEAAVTKLVPLPGALLANLGEANEAI